MPSTLKKQPSESYLYDMDFTPRLALAETIAGVTSIAQQIEDATTGVRTTTTDLTISGQANTTKNVQCRIAGGTAGVLYVVTFVVTTSAGNTVEAEGYLAVENT